MTDPRLSLALEAIRRLQEEVRWKPGKALPHLEKRIKLGHLPEGTTLTEYKALILGLVADPQADLFIYQFGEQLYPTVVATARDRTWLVMVDADGLMETAFPPNEPDVYFADPRFTHLGRLEEVQNE